MNALELLTAPVAEPITLAAAKAHMRIDDTSEDTLVTTLIVAARQYAEEYTGRALATQSWRLWRDAWPDAADGWWDGARDGAIGYAAYQGARAVELPKAPLQSIAQVRTFDADDNAAVWNSANYLADTAATPGRLIVREGQSWPVPGRSARGIAIDFTCGYVALPAVLQAALLQLVTLWFENRGTVGAARQIAPLTVTHILDQYRVRA